MSTERPLLQIDRSSVRWSRRRTSDDPVLLVLHGHGMDESLGFELHRRLPPELAVAFLRGPLRRQGGYGWFPLDASVTTAEIRASADAVLDWMDAEGLDRPVHLLGFSQGACTAVEAVCAAPERFASVVNLSGFVSPTTVAPEALRRRRLPALYARGEADTLVPALLVHRTRRWMRDHLELTERSYPGLGHSVDDAELVDLAAFLEGALR
ncbi:alpha/beta fold hydrolase [Auraticoccus sp. F435]|uniref:Alpha/beta fold hydrolase n=1 Tax=Auraticoccus cholistanensis TaxID=2656650 RepID=A0A6A9UXZ5_9ACTN|nr:alpha/beta fold hydrolase [Auraticoccus cholistanensis]MVA76277.1 alpha/beta fold hydrolase [Auraticoccus cholistanensis]